MGRESYLDLETTFELFETHWNTVLKLIHQHSNIPKGRVKSAEDVTQLVETAVASALAAQASIADTYNDVILAKQMNISRRMNDLQNSSGVPSIIGRATSSTMSVLEPSQSNTIAELQRQLALTPVTACPPASVP